MEKRKRKEIPLQESLALKLVAKKRRTDLVPTGSTLLNLALSGKPYGGFKLGTIVNVVGDYG